MLGRLTDADVDFVVIGGMARTLLGSPRLTKDLDISYSRERANLSRLGHVLEGIHARPRGFPEELPFVADEATLDRVTLLRLETDLGWIDLLLDPAGSPAYEQLRDRAAKVRIGDMVVAVASVEDMIAMKQAAGREQDIADIVELERIRLVSRRVE